MSNSHPKTTDKRRRWRGTFWFNMLIIVVVCVLLYVLFFSSLSVLTRHGDDRKVPKLTGMSISAAMRLLEDQDFDVRVDSTYYPEKKALVVLDQMPDVGELVKHGRTIFLTVNKSVPPETSMPNLVNLSYRSALLILKSNRLVLGDTLHKPSFINGAVLEMLYNGKPIRAGDLIPQGANITLVIADGFSKTVLEVPDVLGMTYPEAVAFLSSMQLEITAVNTGEITDSASARVYMQDPASMTDLGTPYQIRQGDFVTIFYQQNPSDSLIQANREKWKTVLYANPQTSKPDTARRR